MDTLEARLSERPRAINPEEWAVRVDLAACYRLIAHFGWDDLILTHISALGTLRKSGPMSAGDLAACERVQPPSMTKVIAYLEERGLVRREAHPSDKRSAIIAITEQGLDLLNSERRSRDLWLTQRLSRLTPDERALVRSVIPVLDKLASE